MNDFDPRYRSSDSPYDPNFDLRVVISESSTALYKSISSIVIAFAIPIFICYIGAFMAKDPQEVSRIGISFVLIFISIASLYSLAIFPTVLLIKCLACVNSALIVQARYLFITFVLYCGSILLLYRFYYQ